jgi:hypothetical protein
MPSDRIHPVIGDHLRAILSALETAALPFPVGEWDRPKDLNERFENPPYAVTRIFPSTGQFDGPISNTQIDINLRFQILGVGETQMQAIDVSDICRPVMVSSLVTVAGRKTQDLKLMVVSGGARRDDDLQTPFFYSTDLYELRTTPS